MLTASVQAQEPQPQPRPQGPGPLMSLLPFVIIFFIFYFLMIRPQKRRLEEERRMLASIATGDEVVTKSGVIGTIAALSEKTVTLQVDGARLRVLRDQIGGPAKNVLGAPPPGGPRRDGGPGGKGGGR